MPLQEIKRTKRPHLRSRAEPRLYGVRLQPIFPQDLRHDLIDPLPVHVAVGSKSADLSIAGGRLRTFFLTATQGPSVPVDVKEAAKLHTSS